jgi:NAD-dependent deacetylase
MESWREELERAAELMTAAGSAFALTGAGISVHSGIPDFRSPGGLWSRFDPDEVASADALVRNPRGVWEFLMQALDLFGKAEPNAAHLVLADMERDGHIVGVVTQNIDGLHQAAGSRNVVEFHGNCERFYCMHCGRERDPAEFASLSEADLPVLCKDCGGLVRPDVVFFGEGIPGQALEDCEAMAERCDALLIVGTSGEVAPVNMYAARMKHQGKSVIEVNLGATAYRGIADVSIDAPAEEALPELYTLLGG